MAGYLTMLRAPSAPPLSRSDLRAHIAELARLRGSATWFDAFEPFDIPGGAGHLHLDVLDATDARATVVFAPGTNAYALLYGEFLTALAARGINVVGLDPRGHGRSAGPRGSYTLTEIIDDVDTAVRWARNRYDTPIFVAGSSQGGIAGFYYAATGADVAGVFCHNIADLDDPGSVRCMRYPAVGAAIRPYMGALAARWPELPVPMVAYLDLAREPVRGAASAAEILLSDPLTVPFIRLRALASLAAGPMTDVAERVTCPVFVLHAERDNIFPEDYVRAVFDRVRAPKTMKTYRGLAHYMVVDDVDAFIDDADAFITETLG